MLIRQTGDLIYNAEMGLYDVIVHGCNCFCVMGAGIAKQIADHYPAASYEDFKTMPGDKDKLGSYTYFDTGLFKIVNAYTQYEYGRYGNDLFDYTGFNTILNKLYKQFGAVRYGFPKIGMGLAGGNEVKITRMLEKFALYVTSKGGSVTMVDWVPQQGR